MTSLFSHFPVDRADWRPSADLATLAARAELLARVRVFFRDRGVMEVETPLLSPGTAPEPNLEPIACCGGRHLVTSPERHMKRLLAAGSGPIYQVAKAFREDEAGRRHNPEFTLLEWYRPGWSMTALMGEVADLVRMAVEWSGPPRESTWSGVFRRLLGVDPLADSIAELERAAREAGVGLPAGLDREGICDLLLSEVIEPALGTEGGALFLTGFPASRAAMAEIDPGPPPVARRFELYVGGMELANGYQEEGDARCLAERFQAVNDAREQTGRRRLPTDPRFLAAMEAGLPPCAGVALGLDRLLMLRLGRPDLREVLAFPWDQA
ncbi:MAG: EF-P lysine aminoacylase GenX [Magnetococcales bacterium]|nr:EF-P lysine aminoacylase GenX [Magnetococcales bacterium]MBF0155839.1 EF-P lysine aminoacylase GenX [Magnetococcales bacterium]